LKTANKNALKSIFRNLGKLLIYLIQTPILLILYLPTRIFRWIVGHPLEALIWGFVLAIFSFIIWGFGGFIVGLFNAYVYLWAVDPLWGGLYTLIAIGIFVFLSTATWFIFWVF